MISRNFTVDIFPGGGFPALSRHRRTRGEQTPAQRQPPLNDPCWHLRARRDPEAAAEPRPRADARRWPLKYRVLASLWAGGSALTTSGKTGLFRDREPALYARVPAYSQPSAREVAACASRQKGRAASRSRVAPMCDGWSLA